MITESTKWKLTPKGQKLVDDYSLLFTGLDRFSAFPDGVIDDYYGAGLTDEGSDADWLMTIDEQTIGINWAAEEWGNDLDEIIQRIFHLISKGYLEEV